MRTLSRYEAGFDGHGMRRELEGQGMVQPRDRSFQNRGQSRARRAKPDRIDLERTMRAFLTYLRGEPQLLDGACAEPRGGGRQALVARARARAPAAPSSLHEGIGFRAMRPTGYQRGSDGGVPLQRGWTTAAGASA